MEISEATVASPVSYRGQLLGKCQMIALRHTEELSSVYFFGVINIDYRSQYFPAGTTGHCYYWKLSGQLEVPGRQKLILGRT